MLRNLGLALLFGVVIFGFLSLIGGLIATWLFPSDGGWRGIAMISLLLQALIIAVLCTIAFSVGRIILKTTLTVKVTLIMPLIVAAVACGSAATLYLIGTHGIYCVWSGYLLIVVLSFFSASDDAIKLLRLINFRGVKQGSSESP